MKQGTVPVSVKKLALKEPRQLLHMKNLHHISTMRRSMSRNTDMRTLTNISLTGPCPNHSAEQECGEESPSVDVGLIAGEFPDCNARLTMYLGPRLYWSIPA